MGIQQCVCIYNYIYTCIIYTLTTNNVIMFGTFATFVWKNERPKSVYVNPCSQFHTSTINSSKLAKLYLPT